MNTVDLILIGLFILGIVYGYRRGFVQQAVGILGLLISFAVAYSLSKHTAVFLQQKFPIPEGEEHPFFGLILQNFSIHHLFYTVISFIVLFFLTRFLWKIIGGMLAAFAELPIISLVNRWLGATLGFLQVVLIVVIAMNVLPVMPDGEWKQQFQDSQVSAYILDLSPFVTEKLRDIPKQNIDKEPPYDADVL
jgi:uncharacterized membrane protein required for colicin V production